MDLERTASAGCDTCRTGFSHLGGMQQPPAMCTDQPYPEELYQQEQADSARACREVVEDIGMALTGETVLFPSQVARVFHLAAEEWYKLAPTETMAAAIPLEREAALLRHLGDVFQDSGEKGLVKYLLGVE